MILLVSFLLKKNQILITRLILFWLSRVSGAQYCPYFIFCMP